MQFFKSIKNNNYSCVGLFIIFVLSVICRLYGFSEKKDMFMDEYLSFTISYCNDEGWMRHLDESKIYTGRQIRAELLSEDNSLQEISKDISNMRRFSNDSPHTNLYYSLLRMALYGADSSDFSQVMLRGFILNMLFFLLSFALMYKLASRLFTNKILVLCSVALAFLSPASIGNTLFFRPYQLQETLFILFAYAFFICCVFLIDNKRLDKWYQMLILAFIFALTLLSGYFAIILVLLFGVALFLMAYKYNKKSILFFLFTSILGVVFTLTIYFSYFYGLSGYRGSEALDKLEPSVFMENIIFSLKNLYIIFNQSFIGFVSIFILALVTAFILWKKRREIVEKISVRRFLPLVIVLCSFVWVLAVIYFAPMKMVRYIAPALPLVALIVPFLLSFLNEKVQKWGVLLFILLVLGKTVFLNNILWEKPEGKKLFQQDVTLPLIFAGTTTDNDWGMACVMPFLQDMQMVEFSVNNEDFHHRISNQDKLYVALYFYMANYTLPAEYEVESVENDGVFSYYLLKRRN